jgi:predicted dinucleotide-binding enzyme
MNQPSTKDRPDTLGIIGAGRIGQALARIAVRAKRPVIIANSRGPDSLASVVAPFGSAVTAGNIADAAACAMVALAVPWENLSSAVSEPLWDGQIVIDATNAVRIPSLEPIPLGGRMSSEIVAELVSGAHLVRAANRMPATILGADPTAHGGRRVIFVSGDQQDAKAAVSDLFENAGYSTIDLGDLVTGSRLQQGGGPLAGQDLVHFAQP